MDSPALGEGGGGGQAVLLQALERAGAGGGDGAVGEDRDAAAVEQVAADLPGV